MYSPLSQVSTSTRPNRIVYSRRIAPGLCLVALLAATLHADARPLAWRRLERPASQKGQAASSSYVERSVTLSAPGLVELDFFVDSEEEHDFFEVRVDGSVKFSASGRDRGGTAKVALTSGTHLLRFAYVKDAQGSAGQDTAWLGRVRVFQGNEVLENHVFNESSLGPAAGFTAGGSGGGFQVSPTPRRHTLRRPVAGAFLGYQLERSAHR